MKKLTAVLFTVLVTMFLFPGDDVFAAIRVVGWHDTWPTLEKELEYSKEQIVAMNSSLSTLHLYVGETILFVDDMDVKDAMQWLIKELHDTKDDDPYHGVIVNAINDLQDGIKCFSKDQSGLPFFKCIEFAEKWRATQRK
jgi:hypothetical protein